MKNRLARLRERQALALGLDPRAKRREGAARRQITNPPSTCSAWPVMYAAAGDAR
jgi:hypothetical protein